MKQYLRVLTSKHATIVSPQGTLKVPRAMQYILTDFGTACATVNGCNGCNGATVATVQRCNGCNGMISTKNGVADCWLSHKALLIVTAITRTGRVEFLKVLGSLRAVGD